MKINHISCLFFFFLCIHQVYKRYNRVDLCTLFVFKWYTNHLHIFVRDPWPFQGLKNSYLYPPLKYISWHQNTTTTTTITIYCTRCKNNSFALVYTEYIKIMNSAFTSTIFFVWLSPLLCVGFAAVMVILFWRFKWVYAWASIFCLETNKTVIRRSDKNQHF